MRANLENLCYNLCMARYGEELRARVPDDLLAEFERIAQERNMSVSNLLRKVVSNFVKRNKG